MRNLLKFLIAGTLVAGTVAAQEQSESVAGVLKALNSHTAGAKAPAPAATVQAAPAAAAAASSAQPSVTAKTPPVKKSRGWKFWKKSTPEVAAVKTTPAPAKKPAQSAKAAARAELPAAAVAALNVPATMEASRELYTGGEFEKAQRGFEAIIKKDPENFLARMYLRKILERDHRTTEVQGMKAVTGAWKTGIVLRSYAVSPDAVKKMGLEGVTNSADVTAKFPEVGFPKGSSVVYQPKTKKLYVRNTRENLTVLEEILDAMDVAKISSDVDQVEIEAKFVEVAEGTLNELGFEWNFTNPNGVKLGTGNLTANDGNGLFANTLRGSSQNPTLPFTHPNTLGLGETSASGDWSAFRFDDTFNSKAASLELQNNISGKNPLDILISALDQSAGTDVLSAPRIVTESGKKATIRVGQIHYFPEDYEVGGNEGTIVHVNYEDFSEKLLGVELEVTPKIDGDQITMGLNPKVSELLGWQNYEIAPANSAYSYYQIGINQQFNHDPIVARLPIFKRREIKTEVTLADGATMGMGGLINEKVEKYEDKVPVLGSIPLLGRLFRNEGNRSVKRNLMIFVTAKKVEPTGRINSSRSFE